MSTLVLGIGNLLMGDEGVGIHVIRYIEDNNLLPGIECVDGGTGGFTLMDYFHRYDRVLMIDATIDGQPAGTVTRLTPKFSSDFPPTLTAHDIGLKDLLDALYLLNRQPDIVLFTVSLAGVGGLDLELSADVKASVPAAAEAVVSYALAGQDEVSRTD